MQIVGYDTGVPDGEPALVLASGGDLERELLTPGTDLALTLGERHCAGTIDYSGASERAAAPDGARHLACDRPTAPYCDQHTDRWPCARCTGNCDLPLESCREEHAIYLAAFAPATFKIGVTREWRLETRLREQGADRAAHIATVDNGRIAREREAEIAREIPDRVRVPTKRAGLGRAVDTAAWEELLADFDPIERFDFDYGLDLDSQPVAETVAAGTVRGTKGRLLIVDRDGSTYAVDMRELVGYDVTEGRSSRELQSSLGSFE